jgi:hypothetical protein
MTLEQATPDTAQGQPARGSPGAGNAPMPGSVTPVVACSRYRLLGGTRRRNGCSPVLAPQGAEVCQRH